MKSCVRINRDNIISEIDNRIYSSFIEHMGRAVYTGIYEPGHPSADEAGIRQDVADLIKPLNIPYIRYPGGNFVSGYRWEDGVGDPEKRPVRRDLAWFALETNRFGTNEFMDFCKSVGSSPMMAVNLGTRGPQEACDLLEYCNVEKGTYLSDLRRSHGWEKPHNVKLWCLGNEMDGPWQMGAKTPEEYARIACETAKLMKWMDPDIELVACGSSNNWMPTFGTWERTVLRHCYEYVDYLSLHQYFQCHNDDISSFLASSCDMDSFIKTTADICREIKAEKGSDKDIYLSFDEWNVWYHFGRECLQPEKWIPARPIEEENYNFADALAVGSLLITLINNCDVIKIACLAQLINVIAPISTEPGGRSWVQSIYWPFLYTSQFGRGTALKADIEVEHYTTSDGKSVPYIDCSVVDNGDGLTLFFVNKHLEDSISCSVSLEGFQGLTTVESTVLESENLFAVNTADYAPVTPTSKDIAALNGTTLDITLPKASWAAIIIK